MTNRAFCSGKEVGILADENHGLVVGVLINLGKNTAEIRQQARRLHLLAGAADLDDKNVFRRSIQMDMFRISSARGTDPGIRRILRRGRRKLDARQCFYQTGQAPRQMLFQQTQRLPGFLRQRRRQLPRIRLDIRSRQYWTRPSFTPQLLAGRRRR